MIDRGGRVEHRALASSPNGMCMSTTWRSRRACGRARPAGEAVGRSSSTTAPSGNRRTARARPPASATAYACTVQPSARALADPTVVRVAAARPRGVVDALGEDEVDCLTAAARSSPTRRGTRAASPSARRPAALAVPARASRSATRRASASVVVLKSELRRRGCDSELAEHGAERLGRPADVDDDAVGVEGRARNVASTQTSRRAAAAPARTPRRAGCGRSSCGRGSDDDRLPPRSAASASPSSEILQALRLSSRTAPSPRRARARRGPHARTGLEPAKSTTTSSSALFHRRLDFERRAEDPRRPCGSRRLGMQLDSPLHGGELTVDDGVRQRVDLDSPYSVSVSSMIERRPRGKRIARMSPMTLSVF